MGFYRSPERLDKYLTRFILETREKNSSSFTGRPYDADGRYWKGFVHAFFLMELGCVEGAGFLVVYDRFIFSPLHSSILTSSAFHS